MPTGNSREVSNVEVCWIDGIHVRQGEGCLCQDDPGKVFVPELGRTMILGQEAFPKETRNELSRLAACQWASG